MTEVLDRPLTHDEALTQLRTLEPQIRALGISSLHLFGSTLRNEAGPESDIDLFGEIDEDVIRGLAFFGLRRELSERLGRKVDFIERAGLHPLIREEVEAAAIKVF